MMMNYNNNNRVLCVAIDHDSLSKHYRKLHVHSINHGMANGREERGFSGKERTE